jgi:hypothetical protein
MIIQKANRRDVTPISQSRPACDSSPVVFNCLPYLISLRAFLNLPSSLFHPSLKPGNSIDIRQLKSLKSIFKSTLDFDFPVELELFLFDCLTTDNVLYYN